MSSYYLNKDALHNPNRDNEVHLSSCPYLPSPINRLYLGEFANGVEALAEAKRLGYTKADGCWKCCPEAHHS